MRFPRKMSDTKENIVEYGDGQSDQHPEDDPAR